MGARLAVRYVIALTCGLAALEGVPAFAQESLQAAKTLYASAAYQDALDVLARVPVSETRSEVDQYRAFCLIALGRVQEAEQAIHSVVSLNPGFVPDATEVPPRIQKVFAQTRRMLLPEIARRMYVDAKAALDRKDRSAAIAGFSNLLRLIDASEPDVRESLDETRFLAAGFLDLGRALADAERAGSPGVPAPGDPAPAAAPAAPPDITPPVAVRQDMPAWIPSDSISRQMTFVGAVRVKITSRGLVDQVEMVRSVHPLYDQQLLRAAKNWEYQPARRDGIGVPSELVVEVQLKPPQ
jgi:TonB family protein